jgi:tRNA (guanosine-2'-O-)-methyltransferase
MAGLTVALESLYDPGNRAAVYRTAEAFGLLDVHIINRDAGQKPGARLVSRGTEKWLNLVDYPTTGDAIRAFRDKGLRIFGAAMHGDQSLWQLPFDAPAVLAFGNEHRGLSDELLAACDVVFHIPMYGLAESLNISNAAAIAVAHARHARETALGQPTDLSPGERDALFEDYVRRTARWLRPVTPGAGQD